jgi:hypothetical protein
MKESPSSWLIERLAAGDLPENHARAVRERLGPALDVELAKIEQHNAELLAQHPPERVAREIERRFATRAATPRTPLPVWLATAAAAACAVTLWLAREPAATSGKPELVEQVAERGLRPHLLVYRKTPQGAERLTDHAQVRGGDILQLAYVASGRKYGVIASIDGRGEITFHLPERQDRTDTAVRLQDQGQNALPHAFELDDTRGSERFMFVSADEPFPTQLVSAALRANTQLENRFTSHELTLEKAP